MSGAAGTRRWMRQMCVRVIEDETDEENEDEVSASARMKLWAEIPNCLIGQSQYRN